MHHLLLKKWDVYLSVTYRSSGLCFNGGSGTVMVRTEMRTATPARLSETVSYRIPALGALVRVLWPINSGRFIVDVSQNNHVRPGGGSER